MNAVAGLQAFRMLLTLVFAFLCASCSAMFVLLWQSAHSSAPPTYAGITACRVETPTRPSTQDPQAPGAAATNPPPLQVDETLQLDGEELAVLQARECALQQHRLHFNPHETVTAELVRGGIEPDFAIWEGQTFNSTQFWANADLHPDRDGLKMVAIINNEVFFPRGRTEEHKYICKPEPFQCHMLFGHFLNMFRKAFRAGLKIPDVVFLLNIMDYPVCWGQRDPLPRQKPPSCLVPIMSFHKIARWHDDLLVPQPMDSDNPLVYYPWECKAPKAVWRGTGFCKWQHMKLARCSRSHLSRLSLKQPKYLDVAMSRPYGSEEDNKTDPEPLKEGPLPVGSFISIRDHAKFKYTLALDGISASTRIGKLLTLGSTVLKQESDWLEWFYRALEPKKHYVPFWQKSADDVIDVVRKLNANDEYARVVAEHGRTFAVDNLSISAKMAYWKLVLSRYSELFTDMQAIVDRVKKEHLRDLLESKQEIPLDPRFIEGRGLPWESLAPHKTAANFGR